MPRRSERNLIVGLDIGTSKVSAIVGELGAAGELEVVGHRHASLARSEEGRRS
jgi:cell division protein FtsA